MIYVLEVPAQGLPKAWFAYDDEDFSRKVATSDPLQPWEIYDEVTPRGLLDALGHDDAKSAQARAHYPALCALGDEHGFDTPLYRADHLLGRGVLRAEPVSARAALAAALSARAGLHCVRAYFSREHAPRHGLARCLARRRGRRGAVLHEPPATPPGARKAMALRVAARGGVCSVAALVQACSMDSALRLASIRP